MVSIHGELPKTMKAVRCHGPEDYRLEEVGVPMPGPGEVLVRVEACGICASDVKCFMGAPLFWGDAFRKGYVQAPVTAGHEFIGRVVALGEGAAERHGLKVGDRAISEQIVPCGNCRYCRTGRYWLCLVHDIYGFHTYTHGGMADYMLFPDRALVYKVPDELPVEKAALIEPLACSMHAVERAQIQFGDVVVIAGAGPLGLGMIACARLKNPGCLISVDKSDQRLQLAQNLGADRILNPDKTDVVQEILDLTDGYGCDVYIEATGHPDAVNQGLRAIRKGGNFVEFSVMKEPTTTDWTIIGDTKELNIYGAHLGPGCYPKVIDYLNRGLLKTDGIVTHKLPLERYLEGFRMVQAGRESIKVLLQPSDGTK
ncbi:theronine dehydrogenase-like Zn-dependent dehydrogenase [Chthonomonas calidirosea]|uniref:Threonine dehydrogenase and related Zn-dependent dehydrogenases n=1 Tax=Chthonomonas calidirosea (strain DSM 23976 / ICMP 18418 / T49) TaxID=1303518 RepID=S0EXL0_CHTCT|nr:erythritol/L-threitol dehydrogenase [Chthonomonas calidirosea]CCW36428.1 Threonine dehydrogenase and related Zn-dependent dehydrogenases [Chthonomonas calidirosea T49]CEK17366.1 theronine dehydrogenase-like Zn-dependent dehydrogenase [Chthonomonas calidirosea]